MSAAEQQPAGRRAAGARTALAIAGPLVTFAALVVLWDLATRVFDWPIWLVPKPLDVVDALWEARDLLPRQFWVTLVETLAGFGLAVAIGVPLAVAIAVSRFLERTLYPVLLALNAVPKIAIAPILILWMGFGYGPKIVVALLLCVFPIVIATASGLQSTPPELVELMRSLCATRRQIFLKVRFPAALPQVFVGLKVAISLAVIGAVIGEFVGSSEGLGWVIVNTNSNLNTPLAFGAMALLAAMSVALFYLLVFLERLLVPWARHEQR
ncbi:MAG TPA: ABC transporter permease [Gaiellaceae bacterium]|nr:ABC transporter permease [Gaiellaceae bacterium]